MCSPIAEFAGSRPLVGHRNAGFVERTHTPRRYEPTESVMPIALPPDYVRVNLRRQILPDDRRSARSFAPSSSIERTLSIVQRIRGLVSTTTPTYRWTRTMSDDQHQRPSRGPHKSRRADAHHRRRAHYVGTLRQSRLAGAAPRVHDGADFSDASFLHAHLASARRVYGRRRRRLFADRPYGLSMPGLAIGRP